VNDLVQMLQPFVVRRQVSAELLQDSACLADFLRCTLADAEELKGAVR